MRTALFAGLAAAAAVSTAVAGPALAAKPDANAKFIRTAVEGDTSEIGMGSMAEKKAASPAVRDLGHTLVTDHTASRAKARTVAKAMHVDVPTSPSPDGAKVADRLSKLNGPGFDREWLKAAVSDHKHDIAEYKKEAEHGSGAAQAHARETLPVLQKHLDAAEAAQKTLKG